MYKPLILNDKLKPNIFDSILDPLQKSARFTMDLDSIAAAMVTTWWRGTRVTDENGERGKHCIGEVSLGVCHD